MTKKKAKKTLTPAAEAKRIKQQEEAAEKRFAKMVKKSVTPTGRIRVTEDPDEPKNGSKKKATKKAAPAAAGTPAKKKSTKVIVPPLAVAMDPKRSKMWETSTQEEKEVASLLCRFKEQRSNRDVMNYFTFGRDWDKKFPRTDAQAYARGSGAVATGASLAKMAASTVYQILATLKVYSEETYTKIAEAARPNGVTINWTHLRVIGWRLGKSKYRAIRRKVETEITQRYYTEDELNKLIDVLAPDTKESKEKDKKEVTTNDKVMAICKTLQKVEENYEGWIRVIEEWDDNLDPTKEVETQSALSVLNKLLSQMDVVEIFTDTVRPRLEAFRGTLDYIVNKESEEESQTEDAAAEKIKTRVAETKAKAREEISKKDRLSLKGEFTDYSEDETPRAVLRDGDHFPGEEEPELGEDEEWVEIEVEEEVEVDDDEYETDVHDPSLAYEDSETEWVDEDDVFDESGDVV